MKKSLAGLIVTVSLLALLPGISAATPPSYPATPDQIREYRDSGEWGRDIGAVTGRAAAWLKKRTAARNAPRRPAIVFDIDETTLDNYPCIAAGGFADVKTALAVCVVRYDSPALTRVRKLFRLARRLKLRIVFITGRPEATREGTLRDLRDSGYTGKYTLVMRPNDYTRDSVVPYKAGARRSVQAEGLRIIANVGDQRSDLKGGVAERRFYIPNPMYLTP
jgi:HAD superfamily, subfamily IIIB (Acid phosphatase)